MIDDFEFRMEARDEIRRAERLLTERHIEIFVGVFHGITDAEQARERGCSTGNINRLRHQAHKRLDSNRKLVERSPPRYRLWPPRHYQPVLFDWFPSTAIHPGDHKPTVDWAALVAQQEQDVRAYLRGLKL